jgi:hypothetical protein
VQDAVQNRLGAMQSAILAPVESVKRLLGSPPHSPSPQEDQSELKALRKRVAELESRSKKLPVKKRPTQHRTGRAK